MRAMLILIFAELMILCATALAQPNMSANEWLSKGNDYYQKGAYEDAFKAYDNVTKLDPNSTDAWYVKGFILYQQRKYNESIEAYDRITKINPRNAVAWNNVGAVLSHQGRYEEALICYNKSLELNSKNAGAWYDKGNALYHLRRYNDSIVSYDMAIKEYPKYDSAVYNKGMAFYSIGRYDEALKFYNQTASINPQHVGAWNNKGVILFEMGEYDEAIEAYNKAIEIVYPKYPQPSYNKGIILYDKGMYEDALRSYDQAIEIDPNFKDAWNNKGIAFYALGKYNESVGAYNNATEIDPSFADAWYNMGLALAKLGQHENATNSYNKAIALKPDYIKAWSNKALELQYLQRIPEANEAFAKVRALSLNGEIKIGIFIIFLFVYLLLLVVGYILSHKHGIPNVMMMILVDLLGFFSFGLILSGFFSLELFELFFGIGVILALVTGIAWILLGFMAIPSRTGEIIDLLEHKRERSSLWRVMSLIVIIVYPIVAGIGYFRYMIPSDLFALQILRVTMTLIFLICLGVNLPALAGILVSSDLEEDIRNMILVLQCGHLSLSALFVFLILWSFESSNEYSLLRVFLVISVSFFAFAFLLPYFSGWERSRRRREQLMVKRLGWINELLDILEFPTSMLYTSKLEVLQAKIKDEKEQLIENQRTGFLQKGAKVYHGPAVTDPLCTYIEFLRKFCGAIKESIDQFETLKSERELDKIEIAHDYAAAYRIRRDEISSKIDKIRQTKPFLWLALASILSTILGQLLLDFSSWIGTLPSYFGNFLVTPSPAIITSLLT